MRLQLDDYAETEAALEAALAELGAAGRDLEPCSAATSLDEVGRYTPPERKGLPQVQRRCARSGTIRGKTRQRGSRRRRMAYDHGALSGLGLLQHMGRRDVAARQVA